MTDLYLIAHKVRSEPAFDIAHRLPCPECSAMGCLECDDLGYWWIIPTSGHRAYPYWSRSFELIGIELLPDGCWGYGCNVDGTIKGLISTDPSFDAIPDHYPTGAEPFAPSLLSRLNLKPTPKPPIARRF